MDRKEFERKLNEAEDARLAGANLKDETRDIFINEALQESKGKPITEDWEHLVIAMEEMSELQKEISKCLRGKGNRSDLLQEMADVYICLAYVQAICADDPEFAFSDKDLDDAIDVKLLRCHERIAEMKKHTRKNDILSDEDMKTIIDAFFLGACGKYGL